ncbi:hypothetical protein KSP39_PZI019831 [Platanthera zijinensis]|uniref:Prolyl endopeptidase n=1 Tax=Platanthera zijinensis TaxID=2320716 RepID=A0AAP0B214_9ASPA
MEMFGDIRVDDYYWLRDDSRSNPKILSYLKAENNYTNQSMSSVKQFEDQLYAEMVARTKEVDDISAPIRRGSYYYYERTLVGKDYKLHCRRHITNDTCPPSVYDVMPTGPEAPAEHVILDGNIKAQGHEHYYIGAFRPSPNNKLIVYAEDTKGDGIYTVYVIDADKGTAIGNPLKGVTSYIEWAGDDALVYITRDEYHRSDKVWSHKLLSDQSSDLCLYHEKDDTFSLDVYASESKQYLFVQSWSYNTQFIMYLDIYKQEGGLMTLTPRIHGIQTKASHSRNHFFIKRTSDEIFNSELVYCPIDNTSETHTLIPHQESVEIDDFQLFSGHLAIYLFENDLPKVIVYSLPQMGEVIGPLQNGRAIDFVDPIYSVYPEESQFSSSILRFYYNSMRTPPSVYDYDMTSGISVLKKIQPVPGGFEPSDYLTERKWAVSTDGTRVPISILYKKNLVKFDGFNPLFMYGYGSYGISIVPGFEAWTFTLVDRGFIYAIAHIRGGEEMGIKWYEDGKLLKKRNTFTDFIACAEYLIENKYGSKEKLCINGGVGNGGLLIGAILNMRPDLFKAAVLDYPFVDVVTSLLDPTIPSTTSEWEELGDPRKEEYYYYIKSYSPVDNVRAQNYPNILVRADFYDTGVLYSEVAKFVAKLRATKTDDNMLLLKCELAKWHFSKSIRFEQMQEDAFTFAFIMKALDMVPPVSS